MVEVPRDGTLITVLWHPESLPKGLVPHIKRFRAWLRDLKNQIFPQIRENTWALWATKGSSLAQETI